MNRIFAVMLLLSTGVQAREASVPAGSVAFLGISFIDTSTEGAYFGERPDERRRIILLEEAVSARFRSEGFTLLDLAPIAERLEGVVNPAQCYGCELRMAGDIGADYVLVGEVQKVSNLILSMNLVMREVSGGRIVLARAVDIRGNTDKSWLRGIRYILKNHFFRKR